MITIWIIFLLALALAIAALIISGIAYFFWPVLVVLGLGAIIDILVVISIFKERR